MYTICYTSKDNFKTSCFDKPDSTELGGSAKLFSYDSGFNVTSRGLACYFAGKVYRLRKSGADILLEKIEEDGSSSVAHTFTGVNWLCGFLFRVDTALLVVGLSSTTLDCHLWNGLGVSFTGTGVNETSATTIEEVAYFNNKLIVMLSNALYEGFLGVPLTRLSLISGDFLGSCFFANSQKLFCIMPKQSRVYEFLSSSLVEKFYNPLFLSSAKRASAIFYNGKTVLALPHGEGTAFLDFDGSYFLSSSLPFPSCAAAHAVDSDFMLSGGNLLFFCNCSEYDDVMFSFSLQKFVGKVSASSSSWNYI